MENVLLTLVILSTASSLLFLGALVAVWVMIDRTKTVIHRAMIHVIETWKMDGNMKVPQVVGMLQAIEQVLTQSRDKYDDKKA